MRIGIDTCNVRVGYVNGKFEWIDEYVCKQHGFAFDFDIKICVVGNFVLFERVND